MTAMPARLDGLHEVTELERIPLPYQTLYHTLVFKHDMPVDIMRERHQTGSKQLLTWIQAGLNLVQTVIETQQHDQDEELEMEVKDVVSGFGYYEPTVESSIEILLQLEECITSRTLTSDAGRDETLAISRDNQVHLSSDVEIILEHWSRLRGILRNLGKAIREHQRLRDGIASISSIKEQTRQAGALLDRCLDAIAADKQMSLASFTDIQDRSKASGIDSNDMLELDSRVGLLSLQMDSLQKSFPECARSKTGNTSESNPSEDFEADVLVQKKQVMATLYQELVAEWNKLRSRKDQLWRDLEECDRWRMRIEKMARQIETMLDPVEIFHKMCANLLSSLDENKTKETDTLSSETAIVELGISSATAQENAKPMSSEQKDSKDAVDMEMLWSTLQELDEKQSMVAPAIENMFWVQEGEIQHRTKTAALSPTTPTAAPVPEPNFAMDSPLYPNLEMLERQKALKTRWSNLKTSLDAVGTRLQKHHALLKERANEAQTKKEEVAEDKTLVGSAHSIDGQEGRSSKASSPILRRSATAGSQRSGSSVNSPGWNSSTRFLRGKLVTSVSMDSATVRKFMLVKSEKPVWNKPRPWCPSMSLSSPGMPGFPLQTSTWGYFNIGTSQSMDSLVAAPAPPPSPPPPPATTPPKINRPPFSPGGNRRYTALSKPPPTRNTMPPRSVSAAGDLKGRSMSPQTNSGTPPKTLRRSTSFTNKQCPPTRSGPSPTNASSAKLTKHGSGLCQSISRNDILQGTRTKHDSNNRGARSSRSNSNASDKSSVWQSPQRSLSSEDETVMYCEQRRRGSLGIKTMNKKGLAALTKNDSSCSFDSIISSSNSSFGMNVYGSSLSSQGARSPSPYTPMFGSSFAAARSTAALHTALLASMSSSSVRNSNSSIASRRGSLHQVKGESRRSSLSPKPTASSWMNMDTGNLISALSFTVPTYSFDEEFGSFGSQDAVAAV